MRASSLLCSIATSRPRRGDGFAGRQKAVCEGIETRSKKLRPGRERAYEPPLYMPVTWGSFVYSKSAWKPLMAFFILIFRAGLDLGSSRESLGWLAVTR